MLHALLDIHDARLGQQGHQRDLWVRARGRRHEDPCRADESVARRLVLDPQGSVGGPDRRQWVRREEQVVVSSPRKTGVPSN